MEKLFEVFLERYSQRFKGCMNGDELPKYRRAIYLNSERRPKNKREKSDITRKEQRAMIRAMFEVMLPRVLIVLLCFGVTALLIWLWLK